MMRLVLVSALLLTACTRADPVKEAESDLAFIEAHGATKQELCEAEQVVAEAYRKERDADGYERAKLSAQIACRSAQQALR